MWSLVHTILGKRYSLEQPDGRVNCPVTTFCIVAVSLPTSLMFGASPDWVA
jgi:hypothetical protein